MDKMRKKASEVTSQAATVVGLITLLLIFYILFLPPEERRELLGDENETTSANGLPAGAPANITLLSVNVGRLDYFPQRDFEKDIPNLFLAETTAAEIIKSANPFYVRNGWFDRQDKNFSVRINDLQNTNNLMLSFAAKKRIGILKIALNGNSIYENEVTKYNPGPVELPKEMLANDNEVIFSVSGVGWAFWKTNEYNLEDVKVTADVKDISRQAGASIFVLTGTEYYNIVDAYLRFIPYCSTVSSVGKLDITVNNRNIFSAIPVCDDPATIPIPIRLLNAGDNTLVFKTERGAYSVEQIRVTGDLKENKAVTNYFEINQSQFDDVTSRRIRDVFLNIEFVRDDENKEADISINGHLTRIDQYNWTYSRNINPWVREGNNYVTIEPKTTLQIVNMNVVME